jgi:protein TonB
MELRRRLVYPEDARRDSVEGKTVVRVLIDRKGRVMKSLVTESSGNASLDKTARDAIVGLKFTPAMENGMPVSVWVEIPVMFKLH